MSEVGNKKIVMNLKKSDIKAFEELYKVYTPRIFNFCKKFIQNNEDCEEIVQITFEALWNNREKIDENRPVSVYIFSIAKNWIVNFLKKEVYKRAFLEYISHQKTEYSFVTDDQVTYKELCKILEDVIHKLPERRKLIYKMRREEGYSYKEIADKLSVSESTVNSQITKAIDFIKTNIDKIY